MPLLFSSVKIDKFVEIRFCLFFKRRVMKTKVFAVLMLTVIGAFTLKAQDSCKVELLPLTDISITRGEFRDIQELNHNYLNSECAQTCGLV